MDDKETIITAKEARRLRLLIGKPLAEVERLWLYESVHGLNPDAPVRFNDVGEPVDYKELEEKEKIQVSQKMMSSVDRERIEAIRKWYLAEPETCAVNFLLAQLSALTEVESLMAAVCTDDDVPDATPVCHLARAHRQDSAIVDSEIEKRERAEEALTACQQELDTWRCFHCDEVFTTRGSARDHFGATEGAEPGCLIDRVALEEGGKPERGRGLLMALRKAEDDIRQLRLDNEELDNDSRLWHEADADRVRRIGNREWWQELDSREGERLVLVERADRAEAALTACRAQGEAMRAALRRFGQHSQTCNARKYPRGHAIEQCDCDFVAALSSTPQGTE